MKVSIIVPVYNSERYLEDCIISVLQQSFPKYELILIDDGSTDSSGQICDRFAREYPDKIIVKHNRNQGPYVSRLDGIPAATGDILVFLDSDDCLRRDALERLSIYFTEYDCDMVIFNAQKSPEFPSKEILHPFEDEILFEGELKKVLYKTMIETRVLNSVVLKAVKRKFARLPECVPQNCRLKHGEDLLLSASFVSSSPKIKYMNEGIYHYRVNSESITHVYSASLNTSLKTVHGIFDKLIELWGMPEMVQTHNARKVSGWIDILLIMLKSKSEFTSDELRSSLNSMASDPYFVSAYQMMDKGYLRLYYRILAYCMYKKYYLVIMLLVSSKSFILRFLKKLCRRQYVR